MSGDLQKILKALQDQGFTVKQLKSGRWQVRNADGIVIATLPGNPAEQRAIRNALSYLRRAGFQWPLRR